MNPVFAGGTGIALSRVDIIVGVNAGTIAVGARIGVHTLPFVEYATWPPGITTPVNRSVYPMPDATHVATPDASTPHATSVPEVENTPAPVPAAQLAPS